MAQAVGNGEIWVVDNGSNLEIGDYLISSDVKGHAMKVTDDYSEANIVAKVAENVNWENVKEETIDGQKHKLVSVFFESFVLKNGENEDVMDYIKSLEDRIEELEARKEESIWDKFLK